MRFGHLAQRLFNVPLAIHPGKAEVIIAALADRLNLAVIPMAMEDDDDFDFSAPRRGRERNIDKGYDVGPGGIAIVPCKGTLVQRTGSLRPYSGMTGYDGLRQAYLTAVTDPEVRGIIVDDDSPGGEVAGCFDLVDTMHETRGEKPVWAVLNENAFSAAYAIASACDRIIVPRTGGTGSIGVICMHVDWSQAIDKAGLKVTIVKRGEKKADGRPEIPLSDSAYADMLADIDTMGELFEDTVARNRGMAASKVRAMQAGTFLGGNGVTAGLADAVMAPDAAYRALLNELG
jgi:ClpP class serine protease